jgi:ribose transport system permease protein
MAINKQPTVRAPQADGAAMADGVVAQAGEGDGDASRGDLRTQMIGLAQRGGLIAFLVVAIAFFGVLEPTTFFTRGTLLTLVTAQTVPLLLALALTMTLRLHDLDVSFAALMIMSSTVAVVLLTKHGVSLPVAIIVALGIGAGVGALNGFMVVVLQLPAFIATLGVLTICEGVSLALTSSQVISGLPPALTNTLQNGPGGVPISCYIVWGIGLVLWLVMEYTPFGRYLLFIGGNRRAAELVGLRVRAVRMLAYVASGFLFAGAGLLLAGLVGDVDPTSDTAYLLSPLAAAFLGTTVFQLGRFNVWGTIVAAYTLAVVTTGLELLGAQTWVGDVFQGLALIIAIGLSRLLSPSSPSANVHV